MLLSSAVRRDRAAIITTALLQIIRSASGNGGDAADFAASGSLQRQIESYLRDELADVERLIAAERSYPDA